MVFTELTEKEFTKFVDSQTTKNFFQTIMMKKRLDSEGVKTFLVGVKDDNKVVAASLIAETNHSFMGKKTFEAYKGFIMDYQNKELLKFMTEEVKKFLSGYDALRLIIDPYIPNVSRDAEANIIEGIDNRHVTEYLKELGYQENPDGAQVKWCYCLDINGKTSEQLLQEMRNSTRNYINRTIAKYKLNIKTLKKDELSDFKKITSDTCDRRSFADKSLKYYEDMYDAFGDEVTFKVCELNCDTYIETLEEENEQLKKKVEELSDSSSNTNKKKVMRESIESNIKKIEETKKIKEEKGNIVPLSAAMFILYGDEIIYLFSGSYEEYMSFCGQYRLQWEIIKYAAEHGYKRYNFYGIQDVFNPKGKDRGVYEFKKGFGGYVEELLGSFILPISSKYKLYNGLRKVKKIIKK